MTAPFPAAAAPHARPGRPRGKRRVCPDRQAPALASAPDGGVLLPYDVGDELDDWKPNRRAGVIEHAGVV